jgi:hypothetical protein
LELGDEGTDLLVSFVEVSRSDEDSLGRWPQAAEYNMITNKQTNKNHQS